jgi:hypothetical protein
MSDYEKEGWIPYENAGKRGILRLASFVLPALVTVISLLICWRRHFVWHSVLAAGVGVAAAFMRQFFSIGEAVAFRRAFSMPIPVPIVTVATKINQTLEDYGARQFLSGSWCIC